MKAQDGKLWKNFVVYIHEHHGEILQPLNPLGVWMNQETIGALRNRLDRLQELDRELEIYGKLKNSRSTEDTEEDPVANDFANRFPPSEDFMRMKNRTLKARLDVYES